MIDWLRNTYSKIPEEYGNILVYCTLTGLRTDEACKSIQLIHNDSNNYFNTERKVLEHFRHPDIFIRRTKKAYISIVTEGILEIGRNSGCHSYNSIKMLLNRKKINMKMSYCRKIFATYLRMNGIEPELIGMLQGRIPKSTFVKHYFRPDLNDERIRATLDSMSKNIL